MNSKSRYPGFFRVVPAVARVTFLEVIRDRLFYNTLVFAALLFLIGILTSKLAVVMSADRVILDFGLAAIRLTSVAIGTFIGSALLIREIDRRTIHVALSHPITTTQFVFGKFLGLSWIILMNGLLLSGVYLWLLDLFREGESTYSLTLGWAMLLAQLEGLVMASMGLFLSSFTTTSLSVVFCVGFYLVGNQISQLLGLVNSSGGVFQNTVLRYLIHALPNLEHFNLSLKVTYQVPIPPLWLFGTLIYGGMLILAFLLLSSFILRLRDL